MVQSDREMPTVLRQLNSMEFDYADGDGIDFEPFPECLSAEETTSWFRAWTGNDLLKGDDYLVFGQDGSGGYAALWNVRPNLPLVDQPVVFFGSEGELGVVARNVNNYLWLLASNSGPFEAVAYPDSERVMNSGFAEFAAIHSTSAQRNLSEILSHAQEEFPEFEKNVRALIR